MNKDRKKRIAFQKILNPEMKKGDFTEFIHGKELWQVRYIGNSYVSLKSIKTGHWYILWKKYLSRIFKISREEAFKRLVFEAPNLLSKNFEAQELKRFSNKYLKLK